MFINLYDSGRVTVSDGKPFYNNLRLASFPYDVVEGKDVRQDMGIGILYDGKSQGKFNRIASAVTGKNVYGNCSVALFEFCPDGKIQYKSLSEFGVKQVISSMTQDIRLKDFIHELRSARSRMTVRLNLMAC